jgi:hypothetical protein
MLNASRLKESFVMELRMDERTRRNAFAASLAAAILFSACVGSAPARAAGVLAELRSSAAILPALDGSMVAPSAPAGGVVVGAQPWTCDAAEGFAQIVDVEAGVIDPLLAVSTGGIRLPISPTTTPATCGQVGYDGQGNMYVTQAVVDTKVTPSISRGILRVPVDQDTGALAGAGTYIATTAGLDGNQPTAAAIGPDGSLYVAFLKNGNIKRVINPGSGTTQVVQSVGNTPNGHAGRALAFVGNDLYIGSIDAFSVIHSATSAACTGGCNATVIADGFSGTPHVGVASDGVDTVYFAVSGVNQVWRYTPSTGLFAFIAQGGADLAGGDASNFSFVGAKTNMLTLDAGGDLWIGDDTSNGTATGAGRIWTIANATLASVTGGNFTAGTNLAAISNALVHGPWFTQIFNTIFTPTFNSDGTFTATILGPAGNLTSDAGTWTLGPPAVLQAVANPQGHLTMTDAGGLVLLTGDIMFINVDLLAMFSATDHISPQLPFAGELVFGKLAP